MSAQQKCLDEHPKKLYVDLILEDGRIGERRRNGSSILKKHDKYVGSSGVAFFSERRIDSISDRLGHRKLWKIMETLSTGIGSRMDSSIHPFVVAHRNQTESALLHIPQESVKSYISAYFTHIHPIYPFLIQQAFEEKALDPHLVQLLQESVSFSALYHTILALGCQYRGSGSFVRGTGMAWKLYEVALGLVSEVLFSKESLLSVQGIFAQNASCMQIGDTLIIEAARMAQSFGFNKGVYHDQNESACKRTFWVIYTLEKMKSFACNRTSVLADFDIGTPMPDIPEATFNGFNWFYSMVRFSRLISKAYETLFSISATLAPPDEIQAAIDIFKIELEHWRISIPEQFRPGDSHVTKFLGSSSIVVTIRVHYYYYSVVIALARLSLNLRLEESSRLVIESKKALLNAAQVIVELTRYIDAEAYTPIWILGSMPLTALFILFDFTVHNPTHLETKRNISLLGAVAGYFCQLEFASDGALQTSVLLDLAHIARDYVQDVESGSITRSSEHTYEDRHSRQSSLMNTDLVTPPFLVSCTTSNGGRT
ncbi:hypothetical protein B0O99DRAFT_599320 [Bisporella sp. PMI_857]|nr:hypothetical protein B0O99DRAFT_599320 [Bisporella sp. PMI_857]